MTASNNYYGRSGTAAKPNPHPAKEETKPEAKPEPKPSAPPKLEKGAPVMVNGKPAKLIYLHDKMKIARVHFSTGESKTVNLKDIKPSEDHVQVSAHFRTKPAK